ncbi:unnamed protein product, partial [Nesidiocoris tenuis]
MQKPTLSALPDLNGDLPTWGSDCPLAAQVSNAVLKSPPQWFMVAIQDDPGL